MRSSLVDEPEEHEEHVDTASVSKAKANFMATHINKGKEPQEAQEEARWEGSCR
jgi:hypothetical protein